MATDARSLESWRRQAVRRIQAVRRSTLALIDKLPPAEMARPRTIDRWSVKDVLAHLMTCDEETVRRFRLIARGQGARIFWFESMADADRFNARTVAGTRRLGLVALRRRMERAHANVLQELQRLPVTALRDPSHKYPVVEWLPTPGWRHERHHMDEVKAWWRGQRRPGQRVTPASRRRRSETGRRRSAALRGRRGRADF